MPSSNPIMQVNLSATYAIRPPSIFRSRNVQPAKQVLSNLSFEIQPGEALGLVGSSGAGKTTLVMALMGLLDWHGGTAQGEVLIEGRNLLQMNASEARRLRGKNIALVPQSPMTALNTAISLRSHFEEAWHAHETSGSKQLDARLRQLMNDVQLPTDPAFLRAKAGQISVGQAQRILIALALLHRPSILIADEPTSALDPVNQAEIVKLLTRLNREQGTAILYISHDLVSVLQICDRMAVLHDGSIVESVRVQDVEQATHPTTVALLNSLPAPPRVLLEHKWNQHMKFVDTLIAQEPSIAKIVTDTDAASSTVSFLLGAR